MSPQAAALDGQPPSRRPCVPLQGPTWSQAPQGQPFEAAGTFQGEHLSFQALCRAGTPPPPPLQAQGSQPSARVHVGMKRRDTRSGVHAPPPAGPPLGLPTWPQPARASAPWAAPRAPAGLAGTCGSCPAPAHVGPPPASSPWCWVLRRESG